MHPLQEAVLPTSAHFSGAIYYADVNCLTRNGQSDEPFPVYDTEATVPTLWVCRLGVRVDGVRGNGIARSRGNCC